MTKKLPYYRTQFDYVESGISFDGEDGRSRTIQSDAPMCDIMNIVQRFAKTGEFDHVNPRRPQYLNLADAKTYHEAMDIVADAHELFDSLDAQLRRRFSDDPKEFLKFIDDPANAEELISLGFAERIPAGAPPHANPSLSGNEDNNKKIAAESSTNKAQ